jgi:hypothetical protein
MAPPNGQASKDRIQQRGSDDKRIDLGQAVTRSRLFFDWLSKALVRSRGEIALNFRFVASRELTRRGVHIVGPVFDRADVVGVSGAHGCAPAPGHGGVRLNVWETAFLIEGPRVMRDLLDVSRRLKY